MLSTQDIICRMYCGVLLVIWIIAPYTILQHVEIRPVLWMEASGFDQSIPVCFSSFWIYFSFYLLMALAGLTVEKPVFIRFLYTIGWTLMVAHMIYLFLPNGVSREDINLDSAPMYYQWFAGLDKPRNAFPSLHAALSVIAALALSTSRFAWAKGLTLKSISGFLKVGIWLWVAAIFWSTIALRQHVVLDLIAGSILALLVWRVMKNSFELEYHGVLEQSE